MRCYTARRQERARRGRQTAAGRRRRSRGNENRGV